MKPAAFAALALFCLSNGSQAADLEKLKVLYVGEPPATARAKQFTTFLEKRVGKFESVARRGFEPGKAGEFDVVVLDWPQSDSSDQERRQPSPLGERSAWIKPTVLLGSAGLNLAVVWKVRGGSG
jgi:hypothetical protein